MVYGREMDGRTLSFEPSGALLDASLVMRDRETDSWWSIMTSDAIGGSLEGADLRELPVGEKTTWSDWVARHPETLVLSVGGVEHVRSNPYENYFASDDTFRGMASDFEDDRLPPKAPIYAFQHEGRPHAVAHEAFEGGRVFDLDGGAVFVHRSEGAPFLASSRAWRLPAGAADGAEGAELLARIEAGEVPGAEPVEGFDTFWYTWAAVHEETALLR